MSRLSPLGDPAGRGDRAGSPIDPTDGKTVAEILGEIVWLMTQDPSARGLPIHDIERLVMPAILLRRFHIEYVKQGPVDALMPVRAIIRNEAGAATLTVSAAARTRAVQ